MGSLDERVTLSPCDPLPNTMAKVELSPLIKSMSGTIARRKLSDGTTVTYVVTKKNRLYIHSSRPRVTPLSEREIRQRQRFGIIASAVQLVRSRLNLPSDPKTQKQLWSGLGVHYDAMRQNGKTLTAEKLADRYCVLVM